jgi:hypothetical protein
MRTTACGTSRPLPCVHAKVPLPSGNGRPAWNPKTALRAPNRSFTLRGTGPFVTRKDLRLPWQQEPGYRWQVGKANSAVQKGEPAHRAIRLPARRTDQHRQWARAGREASRRRDWQKGTGERREFLLPKTGCFRLGLAWATQLFQPRSAQVFYFLLEDI